MIFIERGLFCKFISRIRGLEIMYSPHAS